MGHGTWASGEELAVGVELRCKFEILCSEEKGVSIRSCHLASARNMCDKG